MNKKFFLALVFCLFFSTSKVIAAPVDTNFKDDNFYSCVIENYNSKNGGSKTVNDTLTQTELDTIEHLSCSNKGIVDISGIEKMNSLTTIDLSKNEISSIDPIEKKGSVLLETLNLENNKIESIDLSKNTDLTTINLSSNPIAKNIILSEKFSLDIGTIIKLPSEYTIDFEIADTSIAEFKKERNEITPKKIGTTTGILRIKKISTSEETTFNSNLSVEKICQMTGGNLYTVDFVINFGDEIEIESIHKAIMLNEDATEYTIELPTPTKDGYSFKGWYEDENLSKLTTLKNYGDIRNINNTKNDGCGNLTATLYAKWEKIETDKKSTSDTTKNPKTGIYGGSILVVSLAVGAYVLIKIKEKNNSI